MQQCLEYLNAQIIFNSVEFLNLKYKKNNIQKVIGLLFQLEYFNPSWMKTEKCFFINSGKYFSTNEPLKIKPVSLVFSLWNFELI